MMTNDRNSHAPENASSTTDRLFCCAGQTDIGMRRKTNQDQYFIADLHKNMHVQDSSVHENGTHLYGQSLGKLMLVADGMGGENAGDVASEMATSNVVHFLLNSMHWLSHPTETEVHTFIKDLKSAACFTHQMVSQNAEEDPEHHGMGTTLTMAYLIWPMLYVLHVGDSRCYLLRDGRLRKLTKDQTLGQELADLGFYGDKGPEGSPFENVLVSAIGIKGEPEALVYRAQLMPGDRILLCSDGLNAHLSDAEIGEHLSGSFPPQTICQQMINLANERGGRDNTTVIVGFCETAR